MAGLGQRALAGAQGPQASALAASLDHLGLQVTQENVLQVRKALLAEAVQLDGLLSLHSRTLRVRAPAGDPVSGPAAELLNERLDGLKVQFQTHVNALKAAGNALTATAQAYGYTEEQIKASFDPENPLCEAEP